MSNLPTSLSNLINDPTWGNNHVSAISKYNVNDIEAAFIMRIVYIFIKEMDIGDKSDVAELYNRIRQEYGKCNNYLTVRSIERGSVLYMASAGIIKLHRSADAYWFTLESKELPTQDGQPTFEMLHSYWASASFYRFVNDIFGNVDVDLYHVGLYQEFQYNPLKWYMSLDFATKRRANQMIQQNWNKRCL